MTLEEELKINTTKIHLKQDNNEYDLEYRELLMQRSNIKDMLLDEYRKAVNG